MADIKLINGYKELNATGCNLLTDANESTVIQVISSEIRWLTARVNDAENKDNYFTEEQKKACLYLNKMEEQYSNNKGWYKFNAHILLRTHPQKIREQEHIKQLINIGADIRYRKSKNKSRLLIRDNLMFLSYPALKDREVNQYPISGILYVGLQSNDQFISQYKKPFEKEFECAKRMRIDKNGKLMLEKGLLRSLEIIHMSMDTKDYAILIAGAIIGGIITLLASLS